MHDDMILRYQKQFQADPASYHKHSKDTGGYWIAKVCPYCCMACCCWLHTFMLEAIGNNKPMLVGKQYII